MKIWIFSIILLLIPTVVCADSNWDSMIWDQDSWFMESNDSGGGVASDEGGGGGCFIATAAYGSPVEPHVNILRDFRDRFLFGNKGGKSFLRLYNTYSPPMADFIAKHDSLRTVVRVSLLPIVGVSWMVLNIGPVSTLALMLFFISCFVGLVYFRRRYKE